MKTFLLWIRFDGTEYCGSQVQKNGISITERVQDAIEKVTGVRSDIKCCSRTDAGVHAERFAVSFESGTSLSPEALRKALDAVLPEDISAIGCSRVPEGFHARYSCKGKRYTYRVFNGKGRDPFEERYSYRYKFPLDAEKMNAAAEKIVGKQDFRAFMSAGSKITDCVRTVFECGCRRKGDMIEITVAADGFLYNMVRIIAGTLIKVGEGKLSPEDIPEIIASGRRSAAGPTVPAKGLFLSEVYYD